MRPGRSSAGSARRARTGRRRALQDDPVESIAVDLQWHLKVAYASHNPLLAKFADEVLRSVGAASRQLPFGHIDLADAVENQRDSLEAIRSGDATRIEASYDHHLGSLEEHLLGTRLAGGSLDGLRAPK